MPPLVSLGIYNDGRPCYTLSLKGNADTRERLAVPSPEVDVVIDVAGGAAAAETTAADSVNADRLPVYESIRSIII